MPLIGDYVGSKTASFLAGGEFPVPIPTTSGNGFPTFSGEFKRFGVSVARSPRRSLILSTNLRVRPEVRELTYRGGSGFSVYAVYAQRIQPDRYWVKHLKCDQRARLVDRLRPIDPDFLRER